MKWCSSLQEHAFLRKESPAVDRFFKWFFFLAGVATRFAYLNHPMEVVFDEAHFGKFTNWYWPRHQTFWDIHPPFGKLILAITGYVTSWHGQQPFLEIGEKFLDDSTLWIRAAPAAFGSLLPPLMYATMRQMRRSQLASFVTAFLVLLELSIICESKFILTDSFLFFFCLLTFYSYVRVTRIEFDDDGAQRFTFEWWKWIIITGFLMGVSLSIKWVAPLATYGLCGLYTAGRLLPRLLRKPSDIEKADVHEFLAKGVFWIVLPVAEYLFCWWLHFELTPIPTFGWWQHPNSWRSMSFWERVSWLNADMYRGNAGMVEPHQHQSWWYQWPVMYKQVGYWSRSYAGGVIERISCFGNPFCYWIAFLGVVVYSGYFFSTSILRTVPKSTLKTPTDQPANVAEDRSVFAQTCSLLLLGWALNLVPFFHVVRSCFVYHYIPGLLYAFMLTGTLIDRPQFSARARWWIARAVVALVVFGFVFFAPVVYGFKLTSEEYDRRVWFPQWFD